MKRLMLAGLLLLSMAPLASGQSQFYKMRVGQTATLMGQSLIQSTATLCAAFAELQGHHAAMGQQRDSPTNFETVSVQWGVVDPTTNAPSEQHADDMYAELNSMIGNASPSVLQWCSRIKQ